VEYGRDNAEDRKESGGHAFLDIAHLTSFSVEFFRAWEASASDVDHDGCRRVVSRPPVTGAEGGMCSESLLLSYCISKWKIVPPIWSSEGLIPTQSVRDAIYTSLATSDGLAGLVEFQLKRNSRFT